MTTQWEDVKYPNTVFKCRRLKVPQKNPSGYLYVFQNIFYTDTPISSVFVPFGSDNTLIPNSNFGVIDNIADFEIAKKALKA